jgi:hypothetical protein
MAFSKRGKRIVAMKKRGELPADAVLPYRSHGEWLARRRRVKLKLERIQMMKELGDL